MIKWIFAALLLINTNTFCAGINDIDDNIILINSINSENDPTDINLITYDDIQIVPLQTNDSCLVSVIQEIRVVDSLVFILDDKDLFVFNKISGRFLSKIGKKGSGPEEYISLNSFFIDDYNRTVSIIDAMKNAIITYDFNGLFKEKKGMPFNLIEFSGHSFLIDKNENTLLSNYWMNGKENIAYRLYNKKNAKILVEKSYSPITLSNYACEFSKHPITKIGNKFNFIMPLCDTIFTCFDNMLMPKYIISYKTKMAPIKNFISTPKNSIFSLFFEYGQKGYFTGFNSLFETEEYILLNYRYTGIMSAVFLANKKEEKGRYFLCGIKNKLIKSIQDVPFYHIISCDNNYFIGICQPGQLMDLKISNNSKSIQVKKFSSIVRSLKEDDNPVLFFYKIKNSF